VARLLAVHPDDEFALEETLRHSGSDEHASTRASRWIDGLMQLENAIQRLGRPPRSTDTSESLRAFEWLRRQRRREQSLTGYQSQRLDLVAGFEWDPLGDRWSERLDSLVVFESGNRRVPLRSATDTAEVSLARWRTRQLSLLADGKMPYARILALRVAASGTDWIDPVLSTFLKQASRQ